MVIRLFSSKSIDSLLIKTALLQPVLSILQQILIVFNVPLETTTTIRVVLSAIPVLLSLPFIIYRTPIVFFVTYSITIFILLLNVLIFPNNYEYLIEQSLRFLLPSILPTVLCLNAVKDYSIFYRELKLFQWIILLCGLLWGYVVMNQFIFKYNMSVGYALLLGTLLLYNEKKWYTILFSFILLLIIILYASRGPVFVYIGYIILDLLILSKDIKTKIWIIFFVVIGILFIPFFIDVLGIESRTVNLFLSNEINNDSGRINLTKRYLDLLLENPLLGIGMYGDRHISSYCHNLFLEIYLDFGILFGTLIILFGLVNGISIFKKLALYREKRLVVLFAIYGIIPLMASSSYLISSDLALFIGILLMMKKSYRLKQIGYGCKNK